MCHLEQGEEVEGSCGEPVTVEVLEKIIANQGQLPGEEVLEEIPGIAFIPGNEARRQPYAREVLMMEHFTAAPASGYQREFTL